MSTINVNNGKRIKQAMEIPNTKIAMHQGYVLVDRMSGGTLYVTVESLWERVAISLS